MTSIRVLEYESDDAVSSDRHNKVLPLKEYLISSDEAKSVAAAATSPRRQGGFLTMRETMIHYLVIKPRRVLSDLFLPIGYPHSVREEYMGYQICDSLQGLCSYLRGVVATSAVLTAAGVGDAEASAMSAAMTWAMRDGSGMVGGLLFSYCASSMFDSHVKEFRLFADIMNDVGLTIDMLAPYAGSENILYVTSIATVCKVMCGISAGSTKGSITHHFALRGNMADVNAKESTQETLMSLVGMLLGVALARYLHRLEQQQLGETNDGAQSTNAATVSWTIFLVLTLLHVYANYIGVKLLHLRTLNRQRATEALQEVIDDVASKYTSEGSADTNQANGAFASGLRSSIKAPQDVSESLLESFYRLIFPGDVRLGVCLQEAFHGLSSTVMAYALEKEFRDELYVLTLTGNATKVSVMLQVGASDADELKAFIHAMILRECIHRGAFNDKSIQEKDCKRLISLTHQDVNALFVDATSNGHKEAASVLNVLREKGWDVDNRLYLGFDKWRISWSSTKTE